MALPEYLTVDETELEKYFSLVERQHHLWFGAYRTGESFGSPSLVDPPTSDVKLPRLIFPVLASASSLAACCSISSRFLRDTLEVGGIIPGQRVRFRRERPTGTWPETIRLPAAFRAFQRWTN